MKAFFILNLLVLNLLSFDLHADEANLYVFSSLKKVDSKKLVSENLFTFFEENNEFINFNASVPTLRQSILYHGLNQRQLEINYNTFKIKDPSHPDGVYDLSGLMPFKGLNFSKGEVSEINLDSAFQENQTALSLNLSSLKQVDLSGSVGKCRSNVCLMGAAFLNRQGGVSQFDNSSNDPLIRSVKDYEEDFLDSYGLSFSRLSIEPIRLASHFFISQARSEDDDLINFIDDINAFSKNTTFFLGQEMSKKDFGLKLSFFNNKKSQTNRPDFVNINSYDFRQTGRDLNLNLFYKALSINLNHETFKNQSQKESDLLASINFEDNRRLFGLEKDFLSKLSLGASKEREFFLSLMLSYQNLKISFKRINPSLFQIFDQISGNKDLKPETFLGLSYFNKIQINKKSSFNIDIGYYRLWDLIEFYDSDGVGSGDLGSYQNRKKGENLFLNFGFKSRIKNNDLGLFLRYLRARDVDEGRDLFRRPRWTGGLNFKSIYKKGFKSEIKLKLVGERFDFDSSKLNAIFQSDLVLSKSALWGKTYLSLINLIDEKRQIYSGIGRRGFEIKLGVDRIF